jgi:hypothetical protein
MCDESGRASANGRLEACHAERLRQAGCQRGGRAVALRRHSIDTAMLRLNFQWPS